MSSATFDPTPSSVTPITFASTSSFAATAQSALDGDGKLRMIVHSTTDAAYSSLFARFYYEESDVPAADRPQLNISYTPVPEPATMGLLALGGLSILSRRRSR